jgi:hypothetical protein
MVGRRCSFSGRFFDGDIVGRLWVGAEVDVNESNAFYLEWPHADERD